MCIHAHTLPLDAVVWSMHRSRRCQFIYDDDEMATPRRSHLFYWAAP